MITLADNSMTSAAPGSTVCRRLVVGWACTRRPADPTTRATLEQARLTICIEPLDHHHAMIEAFVEVENQRVRTVLHATARPCVFTHADGLTHVDIAGPAGERLLALSIADEQGRLAYAHTSLLREAGMAAGACDRPSLQRLPAPCMGQTA